MIDDENPDWRFRRFQLQPSCRATVAAGRLLKRTPQYPANIVLSQQAAAGESHVGSSFMDLFKKRYRRATILASVPWFLQDLSTYGIGIFTPTILAAALGKEADHVRSLRDLIANEGSRQKTDNKAR